MAKKINLTQMRMYRAEWARVRKALVELGDFSPADAEAERKAIQREAIGSENPARISAIPNSTKSSTHLARSW